MATKVARTGIKREKGWLYYLDKRGNVSRAKMARGGGKPSRVKPQVVAKAGVKREDGFLYFIDKQGDVAKVRMKRSGSRRRKPARRKPDQKAGTKTIQTVVLSLSDTIGSESWLLLGPYFFSFSFFDSRTSLLCFL